jgi:hypothetical protein
MQELGTEHWVRRLEQHGVEFLVALRADTQVLAVLGGEMMPDHLSFVRHPGSMVARRCPMTITLLHHPPSMVALRADTQVLAVLGGEAMSHDHDPQAASWHQGLCLS